MTFTQVYEGTYISDIETARTYSLDRFDAVVTVCQDSIEDHIPDGVEYHFFEMSDGPDNEYGGRSDYEYFEYAARTILNHLRNDDTILVHCHVGRSRSVSTVIAAIGAYRGANYFEVLNNVKSQRPSVNPDPLLADHAKRFIEARTEVEHGYV